MAKSRQPRGSRPEHGCHVRRAAVMHTIVAKFKLHVEEDSAQATFFANIAHESRQVKQGESEMAATLNPLMSLAAALLMVLGSIIAVIGALDRSRDSGCFYILMIGLVVVAVIAFASAA